MIYSRNVFDSKVIVVEGTKVHHDLVVQQYSILTTCMSSVVLATARKNDFDW